MKIAIVGAGITGLGAAWRLCRDNEVVVYEAADYVGGHANTRDIEVGGRRLPVDTGFIVYNETNYPYLTRLFAALGVPTEASDMSFAVSLDRGRIEYEGSLKGLIAQPANALRPSQWRMLHDLLRFYRSAPDLLHDTAGPEPTLNEVLAAGGYSRVFAERHILPMAAAIWSSPLAAIGEFPARSFARFFVNHGLFDLSRRPQWRTVTGGSREYLSRLTRPFAGRIRLSTPVVKVRRTPAGVWLRDDRGQEERFDQLVLATHADQALKILAAEASGQERSVLGAFRYQANPAVVHCDPRLLPKRRALWASWNYLSAAEADGGRSLCVSYWMNRLQNLATAKPIVVTLNPVVEPAPETVFLRTLYDHPQFDHAALQAQRALPDLQGLRRTWFGGSYCGYGFHEDGLEAGFAIAAALGAPVPWQGRVPPASPAAQAVRPATFGAAAE